MLFFTELWERFSYYGMRALLVLYMVDATRGLGLDDTTANAIYGLYTAGVYIAALPGGWIADRLLGAQRAIWYGGILIAAGHFTLALPYTRTFFAGLLLIILGTGLLKPNISAVVGELYAAGDPRRDGGFTLFYMGINLGAFIGPFICSTLGENPRFGWHYGFASAGVGMVIGLWYFRRTKWLLGSAGLAPSLNAAVPGDRAKMRTDWIRVGWAVAAMVLLGALMAAGVLPINPVIAAERTGIVIALIAAAYFLYLFIAGDLSAGERKQLLALLILIIASAVFWAGFEQAGSSLNLFAARYTDRMVRGFEIPAGWFQSLNSWFVLLLAPAYASLWVGLARRNRNISTPVKFAIGLVLLAGGFGVMIGASTLIGRGQQVLPTWLIFTYLLHTMGEMALSPVGLSVTTKLAPARYVGQMMGLWFVSLSLGNLIAGLVAGRFRDDAIADMPGLYTQIVLTTAGAGILMFLFAKPIRRLMGNVE
jgi:POT family proton-dependent oligopeptide transporter